MNKQHIDWELNQSKIYIEAVTGTFGYWQNEPERQNEKFRSVLAEIGDEALQKQLQQEIITHFPNIRNYLLYWL
jgi:sulfite reductase beta subunit-like hemoprotein